MTNNFNMQKELEETAKCIEELKKTNANIRKKFSKKQVEYETLLEEVEALIEEAQILTWLDDLTILRYEEAKLDKNVEVLEEVKSECEGVIEKYWEEREEREPIDPILTANYISNPVAFGGGIF